MTRFHTSCVRYAVIFALILIMTIPVHWGTSTGSVESSASVQLSQTVQRNSAATIPPAGPHSTPSPSVSPGSVAGTLDLLKDQVLPGNTMVDSCADPYSMISLPSIRTLFVACENSNVVMEVNTSTDATGALIPTGMGPQDIVYDPGNGYLYVADLGDAVSILDARNATLVGSISVAAEIGGVALDNQNGLVYATGLNTEEVYVINSTTNAILTTIGVGDDPRGVVYDPVNGAVYVANSYSTSVTVINTTTNTASGTITVGMEPSDMAYDSVNGDIYVTNEGSNTVSVINETNNKIITNITVGQYPYSIAFDNSNGDLYTADVYMDSISAISGSTNALLSTVNVGNEPLGVAYDSRSGDLFVSYTYSGSVGIVNPSTLLVIDIIVMEATPYTLAYDSLNREMYVSMSQSNPTNVLAIDGANNRMAANISVGYFPLGMALDTANGDLFIANEDSANVTVINGATNAPVASIRIPVSGSYYASPYWATYDPANGYIYVSDINQHNVTAINGSDDSVVSEIHVGFWPEGMDYDPANGYLYVANEGSANVTVINTATDSVVGSIRVGYDPSSIAYDSGDGDIYVANAWSGNITVISPSNGTAIGSVMVGDEPQGMAYDPTNGEVFVGTFDYVFGISGTTLLGSIQTQSDPDYVAYDSTTGYLYSADRDGNALSIISPSSYIPQLTSVSVSPTNHTMLVQGNATFYAVASCGGYGCPSGTSYSWSLANNLGTFASGSGLTVNFTAGSVGGIDTIFVNASLNGTVMQSQPIHVTILPRLASISVSPTSAELSPGDLQLLVASTACIGGPCPAGAIFSWSLTNNSMGFLLTNYGTSAAFLASSNMGTVTIFVNATLYGITRSGMPVEVTVGPGGGSGTLASVAISPTSATLYSGSIQSFLAMPTCVNGACPGGANYAWSLNNNLGNLSANTGQSISFVAGERPGTTYLFLNATLNGITHESVPVAITIVSLGLPTLTSVEVSPSSVTLYEGYSQSFMAMPECSGGTCPAGVSYVWSLESSSLGNLSSSTGSPVEFSAGTIAGIEHIYLNATYNGVTVESLPVAITIVSQGSVTLISVTVSATTVWLYPGSTQSFTAMPTCSTVACPDEVSYSWSLTSHLGFLDTMTGPSVVFTAGSLAGTIYMFVNATLNGVTRQSGPVEISILQPTLLSGTLTPSSASIFTDGTQAFVAEPVCQGGACPAGAVYAWTVSNRLGSLSSVSGDSVTLSAGSSTGFVTVFVNLTLGGRTVSLLAVVDIVAGTSSNGGGGGGSWLSTLLLYIVVAAVAVAAVIVVMVLWTRNKAKKSKPHRYESIGQQPATPPAPQSATDKALAGLKPPIPPS